MVETSALLAWLAAALLVAAAAFWLKPVRGLLLQRLNGRTRLKAEQVESASRLLMGAVCLSAVAALLAVAGWMFG
jgi:hypothetical protein